MEPREEDGWEHWDAMAEVCCCRFSFFVAGEAVNMKRILTDQLLFDYPAYVLCAAPFCHGSDVDMRAHCIVRCTFPLLA